VLGRYSRDQGLFPLAEAVHKMTGFAARKFGLRDRGVLKVGAIADLVLFDPRRIIDRGTFEDPKRTPEGIEAVYVNGVKAVAGGKSTGARKGRVLRRGA
jgi:N-acyl-D-amino-acid deacylase